MVLHPLDLPSNHGDWFLGIAAVLLVLTGIVHSLLGERPLIGALISRREGLLASELARFLLRFAWHLTSVTWAVLALILIQLVRVAGTARWWAAASTGAAFTGVGLFDAIYSRSRHVGWPLLTAIGLAALLSLVSPCDLPRPVHHNSVFLFLPSEKQGPPALLNPTLLPWIAPKPSNPQPR